MLKCEVGSRLRSIRSVNLQQVKVFHHIQTEVRTDGGDWTWEDNPSPRRKTASIRSSSSVLRAELGLQFPADSSLSSLFTGSTDWYLSSHLSKKVYFQNDLTVYSVVQSVWADFPGKANSSPPWSCLTAPNISIQIGHFHRKGGSFMPGQSRFNSLQGKFNQQLFMNIYTETEDHEKPLLLRGRHFSQLFLHFYALDLV